MRLLLAEDDRYLSAMLSKGLREHAYAVDVVPDGEAAVGLAAINEYDVIVLDVMMPRRDGFSDLVVDTRGQTARRGGTLLPLTTKEYALLEYLARNAGRVVGRADISAHVWDDNHDPGSNAIDVCVTRLRRKVDSGRAPLIHTRRGAGYVLARLDEE
jgi:DNA-binding response OmpR family regulator